MFLSRALFALGCVLIACGGESNTDGGTGGSSGGGTGGASKGGGGSGNAGTGASSSGGAGASGGTSGGSGGGGGTITGGSGGTGGSAGTPGTGGAPCDALEKAYMDTLPKAKACNLAVSSLQCTKSVADDLFCPCGMTFVNPSNTEAAKTLDELQAQYASSNCPPVACPEIACQLVESAMCQADGTGTTTGKCVDQPGK
jgi:hypothetical protein